MSKKADAQEETVVEDPAAAAEIDDYISELDQQLGSLGEGAGGGDDDAEFLANLDLASIKDTGFVTLVNGQYYEFIIKKAKGDKAKTTGNRTCKLVLEVTEDYPEAGGVIMDTLTLTPPAMWRFKSLVKATGLHDEAGNYIGQGYGSFVGCRIGGKVKNSPWDGEMRSKVDGGFILPKGGQPEVAGDYDTQSSMPEFV